jgi:endonuclease/exonuclease/phosphatase family metal-dependent hydrolase
MTLRHTLFAAGLAMTAAAANAQTHVGTTPVFTPNGTLNASYNTLDVGLWAVPTNGQLLLKPGNYFEPMTISKPCRIGTTGGTVRIAPYEPQSTPFTILSYNTHLFGLPEVIGLPRFEDDERAGLIGGAMLNYPADVIAMQEVWDPEYFNLIRAITQPVYGSGFYGGDREGASVLNSGLYTISRLPLSSNWQFFYEEEDGTFESLSSKGFTRSVVTKNGFTVAIFNTHTQSGSSSGNLDARKSQLEQLAVSILTWRSVNPSHAVIVVGDFNVVGEGSEYFGSLFNSIGLTSGLVDGARNHPVAGNATNCTSCTDNTLNVHFNPETTSTRLDYVFYANSLNSTVRVIPKAYRIEKFRAPITSPVCNNDFCTFELSDHYGVAMDFELQRP